MASSSAVCLLPGATSKKSIVVKALLYSNKNRVEFLPFLSACCQRSHIQHGNLYLQPSGCDPPGRRINLQRVGEEGISRRGYFHWDFHGYECRYNIDFSSNTSPTEWMRIGATSW